MFASLKNKIKEETGTDVTKLYHTQVRPYLQFVVSNSNFLDSFVFNPILSILQKDSDVVTKPSVDEDVDELRKSLEEAKQDIHRLETANVLLEESLRLTQEQKDLITDEHDKIENLQHRENVKLKNLLLFKDQEAVDKVALLKQSQLELDQCKQECLRLQGLESRLEDVKVR